MTNKPSVSQYSDNNLLIVPETLYHMNDVKALLYDGDSVIFYKDLSQELIDIEFHTNAPCIVYLQNGRETITSANNEAFQLCPKDLMFFPKGINLHSDYRSKDGRLNAFLIFFSLEIISEFLAEKKSLNAQPNSPTSAFKIEPHQLYDHYFKSLLENASQLKNSKPLLRYKLLELLHLIDLCNNSDALRQGFLQAQKASKKRNIVRLMNQHAISQLSIADLATLSGRSIASFNRDFKSHYQTTPKRWLTEKRLAFAHTLLITTELSITDIAIQAGYDNLSHFIKVFKKRYGSTPNEIKHHRLIEKQHA